MARAAPLSLPIWAAILEAHLLPSHTGRSSASVWNPLVRQDRKSVLDITPHQIQDQNHNKKRCSTTKIFQSQWRKRGRHEIKRYNTIRYHVLHLIAPAKGLGSSHSSPAAEQGSKVQREQARHSRCQPTLAEPERSTRYAVLALYPPFIRRS